MTKFEMNSRSVLALKNLLVEVITSPSNFIAHIDLKKSLKSQGGLASFKDVDLGIIPSSLNTQKKVANCTLENGYESLDLLRNNAMRALENVFDLQKVVKNKPTIHSLKQRIDNLQKDVALAEKQNVMLIALVTDLVGKLENARESTREQLESNIKFARIEIRAKVGIINNTSLTALYLDNNE
jgi:hypothetical protein